MFLVASSSTIKAKVEAIMIPYIADSQNAFSDDIHAQQKPAVC